MNEVTLTYPDDDSHATSTSKRVREAGGDNGFNFIQIYADYSFEGLKRDY